VEELFFRAASNGDDRGVQLFPGRQRGLSLVLPYVGNSAFVAVSGTALTLVLAVAPRISSPATV